MPGKIIARYEPTHVPIVGTPREVAAALDTQRARGRLLEVAVPRRLSDGTVRVDATLLTPIPAPDHTHRHAVWAWCTSRAGRVTFGTLAALAVAVSLLIAVVHAVTSFAAAIGGGGTVLLVGAALCLVLARVSRRRDHSGHGYHYGPCKR